MTSWSAAAGLANPPNCFPEGVALEVKFSFPARLDYRPLS
jgi:hypothetical protein